MLFSLKDLASKLSPTPGENLHVIKTNTFHLHHFQSVSGLVFVLNTKSDVPGEYDTWLTLLLSVPDLFFPPCFDWVDLYTNLQHIYSTIFIDYIQRNPLYKTNGDDVLNCPLFAAKVEEYLLSIPALKQ